MGLRNHVQRKLLTLMRCLAMPVLMMAAVFILLISAGNVNERQQAEIDKLSQELKKYKKTSR